MMKIVFISIVGIACALYPKDNPILTPETMKSLSRISNTIFIPALVVVSLGSAISLEKLNRFGLLILICLIIIMVSYFLAWSLRFIHEPNNHALFRAVAVSCGSPNAISLPLIVMQTMCEDEQVAADYGGSSSKCFEEATAMMFVYSIGWHLVFWSYGFQELSKLGDEEKIHRDRDSNSNSNSNSDRDRNSDRERREGYYIGVGNSDTPSSGSNLNPQMVNTHETVLFGSFADKIIMRFSAVVNDVEYRKRFVSQVILAPAMISIYLGLFIGLIPGLQW
jgi:predicted permease